jgi:hypothetical protein
MASEKSPNSGSPLRLNAIARSWPLSQLIAESAAVVIAFESPLDLLAIADKLPPLTGFPRLAR